MDEDEVLKKLDAIRNKRLEYKMAVTQKKREACAEAETPHPSPRDSRARSEPLTEEEITRRLDEWRSTSDPKCEACGICSMDEKSNNGD